MKRIKELIVMTVIFTSLIVNGQITKVNTINMPNTSESYSATGALADGTKIYYIVDSDNKRLIIYNAEDQTIIKDLTIPVSDTLDWWTVSYVSDKTFDLDDKLEFLITTEYYSSDNHCFTSVIVINEDLEELFRKDGAYIEWNEGEAIGSKIQNVENKAQMILSYEDTLYEVYELPGKLSYDLNYGTSESSVSITSNISQKNIALKNYPSPAQNSIVVEYNLAPKDRNAILEVIDISGRIYHSEKITRQNGSTIIDVSFLNSGTYLLRLSSANNRRVVNKVVVE